MLQVHEICKSFGPTVALDRVSLSVSAGEVLALIGENGAGKSTLLKILSGAHRPDRGYLTLGGKRFVPNGPSESRRSGVAMIYQELSLAPDLSIEDNLMLGCRAGFAGLLRRSTQRRCVERALHDVGLDDLDPRSGVAEQSVATQQLIEIARALIGSSRIILFDEPTSSLPQKDVQRLFEIIKRLKNRGIGMIYISHFLEEVRQVADRYSVLRDGRSVGEGNIADVRDQQIVSLMVGREVDDLFPTIPHSIGEPWVNVAQLTGSPYPKNVNIDLRRGEILGIAGLVGAGRTELLRTLFGLDATVSGTVRVDGTEVQHTVKQRMRAGFGLLSEDRKKEGLAQDLSILENITIGSLKRYTRFGCIHLKQQRENIEQWMRRVEIKAASVTQRVSELSGGNQQKVAFARILHQNAELLLLDEPTKGVDVGTKAEIYRMIGELAKQGKTIVFVSSYLPELMAICDRIAVMARGELREIRETTNWTEDDVMASAIASD